MLSAYQSREQRSRRWSARSLEERLGWKDEVAVRQVVPSSGAVDGSAGGTVQGSECERYGPFRQVAVAGRVDVSESSHVAQVSVGMMPAYGSGEESLTSALPVAGQQGGVNRVGVLARPRRAGRVDVSESSGRYADRIVEGSPTSSLPAVGNRVESSSARPAVEYDDCIPSMVSGSGRWSVVSMMPAYRSVAGSRETSWCGVRGGGYARAVLGVGARNRPGALLPWSQVHRYRGPPIVYGYA